MPLPQIADKVGTPVYFYSRPTLERHARVFQDAVAKVGRPDVAFAIKAIPNLAVLRVLANAGMGADVVSGGELERARGGDGTRSHRLSGVGKTGTELALGLDRAIGPFQHRVEEEGRELSAIPSSRSVRARAARVNPDVDAGTHVKISTGKAENKLGVPLGEAPAAYSRLPAPAGLEMRPRVPLGSSLASLDPLEAAFVRVGALVGDLRAGRACDSPRRPGRGSWPPLSGWREPADAGRLCRHGRACHGRMGRDSDVRARRRDCRQCSRSVDACDPRQAGRDSPLCHRRRGDEQSGAARTVRCPSPFRARRRQGRAVDRQYRRPVCESGDTFAMARECGTVATVDFAAFRTAGAYGATMASTDNSRALVPEVLVDESRYAVVAKRIAASTLMAAEPVPDWLRGA